MRTLALDHLLAGAPTVPDGRGLLLRETWRMHPDVCAFVSERSYEGRLHARDACIGRRVTSAGGLDGAGLRFLPVEHEGRSQESPEEAWAIAAACRELLADGRVTEPDGSERPLTPADLMVVAPYNTAVRRIAATVPAAMADRVGTVDSFQGQEAAVVFYALTCSSGEDVPRGLSFLFAANRLNVAVSRAQCLSVLVACPRLLDADCRSLEAMRLLDGICGLVERAGTV